MCDNKLINETKNTKFLGLDIDSFLSWKNHIDQMMIKLSTACYAVTCVKHFMPQDTLRTIYFSDFHSILSYGIIFWGDSAYSYYIFKIQKRIIRIIMNARNRDSCHQLFKNLKFLPLKSQYIYFFSFYYLLPKIEIHMNQIQKFIILTLNLVPTYILQLQT